MSEVVLGLVLGAGIALLHAGAGLGLYGFGVYGWGARLGPRRSIGVLLGVVIGRLILALLAVGIVLWTTTADRTTFVATLFVGVSLGLALEVLLIHRSDATG